jgi:hypothetical protein
MLRYLCSSGCIAKCVVNDNSSGSGNITTPPIAPPPAWPPADWPYYCCMTALCVLCYKCCYICRYLCSSGCIAKCVPDDTGNITTPSITPPPAWPPADWSYYCLDGSPAQKCDIPVSDSKDSCDKLGCGASDPTSPILPPEKLICAPWKCGASDTAVCQMTCARDVSFSVPPPLPAGPMCPDKTAIADWCSTGAKQEDVDAQCWQLGCEKDGVMCGEFRCGDTMADGGKQCGVTCVTEAYHKPYM